MNNPRSSFEGMEQVPAPLPSEKNGHHVTDLSVSVPPPPAQSLPPPSIQPLPPSLQKMLWRILALPLLLALTCGLTAWTVTSFFMTHWYQSTVTLYFPTDSTGGGLLQQLNGTPGGDPSFSQDGGLYETPLIAHSSSTALSILSTGRVQSKVMADLHLDKRWHLMPGEAAQRLNKSVSYSINRNGFLAIQAQDPSPALTVEMVNSYVGALQQVSTELTTLVARRNRKALQARLDDLNERLLSEQNDLANLQMQSSRTSPLGASAQGAYVALETQREQSQSDLKQAQALLAARLHAAQETSKNAVDLPAQLPYAQQARQQLNDLERQFAATKAIYGPDYPQYQQQQAQVQQAQQQYEEEVKRETLAVQKGITPDVAQLVANVQGLQAKLDGINQAAAPLRSDLQNLPLDQMRQSRLTSRVALDTEQVKTMTLDVERAQEVEDRTAPAFEVVDAAGVPNTPVLPRVWFTTVFAAVAGFLLALAWKVGKGVMYQSAIHDKFVGVLDQYGMLTTPAGSGSGLLQMPDNSQIPEQNRSLPETTAPEEKRRVGSSPPAKQDDNE